MMAEVTILWYETLPDSNYENMKLYAEFDSNDDGAAKEPGSALNFCMSRHAYRILVY